MATMRFTPAAVAALNRLTRKTGWNKTQSASRAILFADSRPEFMAHFLPKPEQEEQT